MENDDKIIVDDYVSGEDIVIDLSKTYGTTTTYWKGDSVADVVYTGSNDGTFTINIDDLTSDTIDLGSLTSYSNITLGDTWIDPDQVNKMCDLYPGLEKAWRNFKSVYDMVKQDYEGKKKSGEVDDDIPF